MLRHRTLDCEIRVGGPFLFLASADAFWSDGFLQNDSLFGVSPPNANMARSPTSADAFRSDVDAQN